MNLVKDKKKKNYKIGFLKKFCFKLFLFFLVSSFLILFFLFSLEILIKQNYPAVIFFDVGQGDSILLRNVGGRNILIDGGPDNLAVKKLGKFLPYFSRRLDFVIISHYHDDHVVGLVEIFNRYKIGTLILAKGSKSGLAQDLLLKKIESDKKIFFQNKLNKNKNKLSAKIIYLDSYGEYDFGSCNLIFLNPRILEIPENDNNSLITKLDCPSLDFLFSGDNEIEVERALLEAEIFLASFKTNLKADILKASHHGSKTSNSQEFLKFVAAKVFVISAGLNNRFNHPAQEIVERAEQIGLSVKRTDIDGDIVFRLDF